MKTKILKIATIIALSVMSKTGICQVPSPIVSSGCGKGVTINNPTITVKCGECCTYNSQSGNPNTVTHKCVTAIDPYCTGTFVNGPCPECYTIIFKAANSTYNFTHAIIYVNGINKKWIFNPFAPSTSNNSNLTEHEISFTPLDGNLNGENMTELEINTIFNP